MIIYKITNNINNKIYIGQTVSKIKRRWAGHKNSALNKRTNTPLYNAMRKYGVENFTIEEIGGANSQSELNYQEWLLIHKNNTLWPNGYNMMEGGGSGGKRSVFSRIKMSNSQKKLNIERYNSKKVINIETGEVFPSAYFCIKNFGLNKSFHEQLLGKRNNNTPFRYVGMEGVLKKEIRKHSKRVVNTKTGKIYKSIKQCWVENKMLLKISNSAFRSKLNGGRKNNTIFKVID